MQALSAILLTFMSALADNETDIQGILEQAFASCAEASQSDYSDTL